MKTTVKKAKLMDDEMEQVRGGITAPPSNGAGNCPMCGKHTLLANYDNMIYVCLSCGYRKPM